MVNVKNSFDLLNDSDGGSTSGSGAAKKRRNRQKSKANVADLPASSATINGELSGAIDVSVQSDHEVANSESHKESEESVANVHEPRAEQLTEQQQIASVLGVLPGAAEQLKQAQLYANLTSNGTKSVSTVIDDVSKPAAVGETLQQSITGADKPLDASETTSGMTSTSTGHIPATKKKNRNRNKNKDAAKSESEQQAGAGQQPEQEDVVDGSKLTEGQGTPGKSDEEALAEKAAKAEADAKEKSSDASSRAQLWTRWTEALQSDASWREVRRILGFTLSSSRAVQDPTPAQRFLVLPAA